VRGDVPAFLVVLVVVCLLGFVLRWTFKPSRPRTGVPVDAAESQDLGMLDVIAAGRSRAEALSVRATLDRAGIRSSLSHRRDGQLDVLVFHADADRARTVLEAR
jgi:hypothetical protein